jgi:hypothetical protein
VPEGKLAVYCAPQGKINPVTVMVAVPAFMIVSRPEACDPTATDPKDKLPPRTMIFVGVDVVGVVGAGDEPLHADTKTSTTRNNGNRFIRTSLTDSSFMLLTSPGPRATTTACGTPSKPGNVDAPPSHHERAHVTLTRHNTSAGVRIGARVGADRIRRACDATFVITRMSFVGGVFSSGFGAAIKAGTRSPRAGGTVRQCTATCQP